ncbi:MAG: hypothetical protein ACM3YO_07710 [Bacteroidota bacterium]
MAVVAVSLRRSLLVGISILSLSFSGCGANNLTSPGSTTPNLAQPQSSNTAQTHKSLKGTIVDALTGKAVKATLLLTALDEVSLPDASASTASVSPTPSPSPKSVVPSTTIKADDKGHWEVKEVPDGPISLFISAPNYQPITLSGVRPNDLEIAMLPQKSEAEHPVVGSLNRPNGKPADGSRVAASFLPGLTAGDAQDIDPEGAWKLSLPPGKASLAAFTSYRGEITAFSYLPDVPVKEKADAHSLTLRAVAQPVILSGEAEGTTKPQRLQTFLVDANGEIPLMVRSIDARFRVSLPELPQDSSYHLVFSAKNEAGDTAFSHLYNLKDSDTKLSAALLPYPSVAQFDGKSFKWESVPEASFYRIRVEEENGKTLWEGFTSALSLELPELSFDQKKTYRYSLTAIKAEKEWATVIQGPWSASSTHAPVVLEVKKS